jgi:hypothetical protein
MGRIVLNPEETELDIGGLKADARQASIDLGSGAATRACVFSGSRLTVGGSEVFQNAQRTDRNDSARVTARLRRPLFLAVDGGILSVMMLEN